MQLQLDCNIFKTYDAHFPTFSYFISSACRYVLGIVAFYQCTRCYYIILDWQRLHR